MQLTDAAARKLVETVDGVARRVGAGLMHLPDGLDEAIAADINDIVSQLEAIPQMQMADKPTNVSAPTGEELTAATDPAEAAAEPKTAAKRRAK